MTYIVEYCCYCGINMNDLSVGVTYTKDHLIPKCKGGNDSVENKKTCCSECNSEKGGRTIHQYIIFLEKELNRLKNYTEFISLQYTRIKLQTKIENAKHLEVYVTCMGRKLYRNMTVMRQWNKKLWSEFLNK